MKKWDNLQSESGQPLLTHIPTAIDKVVVQNQHDNNLLTYWLATCSVLFHLVRKDVGPSGSTQVTVALADIDKMLIELPKSATTASLKFRDELELIIAKIYGLLLRNVFDKLKPSAVAMVEPRVRKTKQQQQQPQITPVQVIIENLTFFLTRFQQNCIHAYISKQFFQQVLYYLNAEVFNTVILRRELCSHKQGLQLKMDLEANLVADLKSVGADWVGNVDDYFKQSKQLVKVLVTPQLLANDPDLRKKICPDLSLLQIKQVCTMYNTNCDEFETPIPVDVIASLLMDKDYDVDAPLLLDIGEEYTIKTNEMHYIEVNDIIQTKFPQEIVQEFINHTRENLKKDKSKKGGGLFGLFGGGSK